MLEELGGGITDDRLRLSIAAYNEQRQPAGSLQDQEEYPAACHREAYIILRIGTLILLKSTWRSSGGDPGDSGRANARPAIACAFS